MLIRTARIGLFTLLISLMLSAGFHAIAWSAPAARVPLGLNVDINEQTLIDLIQPTSRMDGATGQDSNGWPTSDFSITWDNRYTYAWVPGAINIDPEKRSTDVSGVYKLSFKGQATLAAEGDDPLHGGVTIANQAYDPKTNTTTADVHIGNPPGGVLVVLKFSQTRRHPGDAPGSGLTDIHLIRPGYAGRTQQVFTDLWLDSIRNYSWTALRFMGALGTTNYADWGSHEAYPYRLKWATDRALPGVGPLYGMNHVGVHGIPWEYVVLAANATGKDIWINIPVNASDDYVTRLALLLRDGDAFTANRGLKPNTNIYVEYSNEMWHYGFFEGAWNFTAAKDEVKAGGSNLDYDHVGNQDVWRFRRMAKRTIEIGALFRAVFSNQPQRIRPVIDNAFIEHDADMLDYVTKNYGPPQRFLYAISQTGYYTGKDKSSVAAILAGEKAASDDNRVGYMRSRTIATYYGLHSFAYEGGQDEEGNKQSVTPVDTSLANEFAAARDPGMESVEVHDLVGNWYPSGGELYMQFAHVGHYSTYGMWGLSDDLTDRNTGKWKGVVDTMKSALPEISAGTALDPSTPTELTVQADSLGSHFDRPNAGDSAFYLLRVSKGGDYIVSLVTADGSAGKLQAFVDNSPIGEDVDCSAAAPIRLGSARLPLGLSTLRLVASQSGARLASIVITPATRN